MALPLGLFVAQLISKRADAWDISVRYPRFSITGAVSRAANAEAERRERTAFDSFLADAKKDLPEIKRIGNGAHYELQVNPH